MDIQEFFELSAGKWFSHRTSQDLAGKQSKGSKSDITMEILAIDRQEVVNLCQEYGIDPALAQCGAKISWNGTVDRDQAKHIGSTVLVLVPDSNNPNQGKLLRKTDYAEHTPVVGRYIMGNDEALTLIAESETMSSEERLWFASPNLRMRVNLLKRSGGFSMASFTSEIRMGGAPPVSK